MVAEIPGKFAGHAVIARQLLHLSQGLRDPLVAASHGGFRDRKTTSVTLYDLSEKTYLLLLHIGSGPARTDWYRDRFGELLDHLASRGYAFIRVDELLKPVREPMP